MAAALAAAGHDVTLACGRYQGAATGLEGRFRRGARQGVVAGFTVREFDISCANAQGLAARSLAFLRFAAASSRLALSQEWDLIIASSTPLTVAIPALLAKARRGTPFIFEIRDPWPELPHALSAGGGGVPGPVLAAMGRLADAACRRADAVVALSDGMARTAIARGTDPTRLIVLPQGADAVMFRDRGAGWRPEGLAPGTVLAVYAGAHGRANGLDQLLDAAARLRGSPVRLLLVGEGAEKRHLMARAVAENLPVDFRDPMPKARLAGLLAGADLGLLCLAPIAEFAEWTAPNKLAEGLAAGLPMVANVAGAAARLLADSGAGLAVRPGDAAALAEALLALAADPARRLAMSHAARIVARRRLDARRIAQSLVALAERTAAPRRQMA